MSGVVDEQLWLVPSLDVGAGIDSSAVALFAERARSVASRFGLATTDEATAVVEICRRLDGIPLAIELAASRIASMTVDEINDRLGSRFKLLVGSRRGLGRHQTLRHAVAWSYELLDGAEKALLERCSVFAGGFDLKSACAVTGSAGGDDYAVLDLLDALVRKSLLVADQSAGRTRFSMLETIREFAEEQLAASGEADAARTAHARYFASRETEVLSLWDSPRQRQAHEWFILELPNLRAAFRCAVEHDDLDSAAALAVYATFLGFWVNQHEPITWTEEILKSAQAVQHRKLAQLYVMAAHCYGTGRMDDFHAHTRAAQEAIDSGRFDEVPDMFDATDHGGYLTTDPASCAERCRTRIAHDPDNRPYTRHTLVIALSTAGATDEAIAVADRVLDIDHSADNPELQSGALLAYGFAHREDDPAAAYECHRRGLAIASESWNRQIESIHAISLSRLAATGSNPMEAFTFLTQSLGNLYDSGSFSMMSGPLAVLAGLFDRLAHPEPAAVIAGFTRGSFASFFYPELATAIAHLRMVLGDDSYESLARTGETMTAAQMVTYAYDQIDQARSKSSSAVDRYDPDHDSIPDDPSSPETLVP
ncbi:MAG: hypothetical protein QOE89_3554 [Pseudonocardiales bacterium]|nr:hypothetical protein [Pseudonocardiales bacterium]